MPMLSRRVATGSLLLTVFIGPAALIGWAQEEGGSEAAPERGEDALLNEVIVIGMIHRGHRQPGPFDLEHLRALILAIEPDVILTEIPPVSLEPALTEFRETGEITEPRVRVFPEYTDAVFPLTKEMDFEIVGCAGWTKAMNDSRRAALAELRKTHAGQYQEMNAAQALARRRIAQLGSPNDPVVIHTDRYDGLVQQGMEPYDLYFNDLIGDGGWSNINAAHNGHIRDALDAHTGKGQRVLITFGAWHKNSIKNELRKRKDIKLIPMSRFLRESEPTPYEWPRFRGTGGGTGSFGATEIANPKALWEYDTGEVIESSAAVVGDTVYIGGHAKRLHALDRESGKPRWTFEVGGLLRSTPSVADGIVYFGADDNKFYAVDVKTGKKLWDFELGEGGEQSTAVIADGTVYFGAFDGHVYALDAKTGAEKWKRDVGSGVLSSPALARGTLFIGTNGGALVALDASTGDVRWKKQISEESIFSSPVVAEGLVYFTSYDKHIYAVQAADGEPAWKRETGGSIFSSPAVFDGTLYVGSNDKNLYALDPGSGEVRWKTDLGGSVFSSPAVTEDSVYVGSSDGNMYALDRGDGAVRWKHSVGEDVNVWTSPMASQGRLYFGSHAGKVVVLQEAN